MVAMNHAEILATKWLKAPELKALAEENGKNRSDDAEEAV
jgi:hypothetical protein